MKSVFHSNSIIILFVVCISSRLLTSIDYIEDIDSLRFALSLDKYSLIEFQPHFPGYPIFCFVAKMIFILIGNIGLTFSIIGGLSVFFIIYFVLKICRIDLFSRSGIFCFIIIFFNPLIWLMSNRYMPDIMGLAIAIAGIYYLTNIDKKDKDVMIGFLLFGLLAGTRLSYLPLLFVPFLSVLIKSSNRVQLFSVFLLGCLVWLLPLVLLTGITDLITVAGKQTLGHFSDFGGTAITENDWSIRMNNFVRSIWSDGLGGYWPERSWVTIVLSLPMIYIGYYATLNMVAILRKEHTWKMILFSLFVYTIWVFFFQNIIYKSRHILPILVILLMFFTMGQNKMFTTVRMSSAMVVIFFISLIVVTSVLVSQHAKPTAVAKLKDSIINSTNKNTIISIPLINYYLRENGVQANFINIHKLDQLEIDRETKLNGAMVIGDFNEMFSSEFMIIPDTIFYHNPYMNRMWSSIETYTIVNKQYGK